MQTWTVDAERGMASCEKTGYRQVFARQRPLDVKPLADEVTGLILQHATDPRIKWQDKRTVSLKIGVILPKGSTVKMTLTSRRRRFRAALTERLAPHGWIEVWTNKYQRTEEAKDRSTGI